jgi:hypothetical protein
VLLAVGAGQGEAFAGRARDAGVDALCLGTAGGERLELSAAERDVSVLVADAARAWDSLGERVDRP